MAQKKISNFKLLSVAFAGESPLWADRINLQSQEFFDANKTMLASDAWSPIRNEVFQDLVNRIAWQKIKTLNVTNPLSFFNKGSLQYGDTIQETAVDIITGQKFTGTGDQFEKKDGAVKVVYHRINREDYYQITVEDVRLRRAFTEQYGLQQLLNEVISTLRKSNTVDEYLYMKKAVVSLFRSTSHPIKATQRLQVPNILSSSRTQADILKFVEQIKKTVRKMVFNNRSFNAMGKVESSLPSDLVLILNTDVTVINEVYNLATAFNPDFVDVKLKIVGIDSLDDNYSALIGCILDREAIEVYDTYQSFKSAENVRGLYTNYFFHVHQLYKCSPFSNAIFIEATDSLPPLTEDPITNDNTINTGDATKE